MARSSHKQLSLHHDSSIVRLVCRKCPFVLCFLAPTTSMHYSRKMSNPYSGLSSYTLQCRRMKAFNSAKNSLIGFRSGEYGGKYTSLTPASKHIWSIRSE